MAQYTSPAPFNVTTPDGKTISVSLSYDDQTNILVADDLTDGDQKQMTPIFDPPFGAVDLGAAIASGSVYALVAKLPSPQPNSVIIHVDFKRPPTAQEQADAQAENRAANDQQLAHAEWTEQQQDQQPGPQPCPPSNISIVLPSGATVTITDGPGATSVSVKAAPVGSCKVDLSAADGTPLGQLG